MNDQKAAMKNKKNQLIHLQRPYWCNGFENENSNHSVGLQGKVWSGVSGIGQHRKARRTFTGSSWSYQRNHSGRTKLLILVHISYTWSKTSGFFAQCKKKKEGSKGGGKERRGKIYKWQTQFMKRCSTSHVIRELQTKIMRCHYTSIRIAKTWNTGNNQRY